MKKVNFLFCVLLLVVFGVYSFYYRNNLSRSSSTLYAVYCTPGDLSCEIGSPYIMGCNDVGDDWEHVLSCPVGKVCVNTSTLACGVAQDTSCVEEFECASNQTWDGCLCHTVSTPRPPTSPPSCTAVNGVCSTTLNTCSAGTASGVGTTQVVSTGINNIWRCVGSCGGGTDTCSRTLCTNATPVDGTCKPVGTLDDVTNHTLCVHGTEANVNVTETTITWNCLGSTNTCAEGDGDDANCSSPIDQKAWFQVNDGSILTKGKVVNYVPQTTCDTNGQNCASTVNNGAIYSKSSSSPSGSDRVSVTSESGFNFKTYTYNQLKSDYFDKKGVGSVFEENADWSNVKNVNKVAFVNGDLEINSDLDTSNFVMVIAKGKITIDPSVSKVNAILVGNEVVAKSTDDGSTDAVNQLVVNGMVHGVSGVKFTRNLYPNNLNNTTPSVVVNYKPELLFMIPQELTKAFSQWKIN